MRKLTLKNLFTTDVFAAVVSANAQLVNISADVTYPGHEISPMLWGIFFEDINLSADGGLFPNWRATGRLKIRTTRISGSFPTVRSPCENASALKLNLS